MTLRDALRPKSIALDAALVAAFIVGTNILFDRAHPGWTNLNPSPYLLIPVLLGGRYGFASGVLAGLASVGLILLQQLLFATGVRMSLREALAAQQFLFLGLLFAGGICGELFGWFRRDRAQAEAQLEKLGSSVRRLDADVRYLRGVKDELDRVVAARDGEVSALDTGLRRLQAALAEDIPAEVLQFLKRQVRLADAAVYAVSSSGQPLIRLAHIGRDVHLPAALSATDSPLIRLALERGSLVALPELLQRGSPPDGENTLLAAPLRDVDGRARALLVVTGIPFINFNAQSANLIALICDWAGEALDLASEATGRYRIVPGRTPRRVFTHAHFKHLLTLALQAHQRHRLPSSVILLTLPGAPLSEQSRFESALLGAMRNGDYAAELGLSEPHLAVLLPLIGERGAEIFVERCRQFLKQHGPWSVPVSIRRVEFGRSADAVSLLAELEAPQARSAS
jgi:hypothetical protein